MVKAVRGVLAGWGKCSRTVLLDDFAWALSYHNDTIAIGSNYGDIITLNAITGSQMAIFSGHTGEVYSVMFSSDGTLLVSGSNDSTVKLWDVQTGGVIKTFSGHAEMVWTVSISADCTTIASGSYDHTICLWNTRTGNCCHTIECKGWVNNVSFSPTDPQHLISIASGEVLQWDANGHQIKSPHKGSHVAFSSDGVLFALCNGEIVTVQSSVSGAVIAKFQVASRDTTRCCFSPDGKLVAVAATNTIYVWDISSDPYLVESFSHDTSSLVFSSSSSLISTSFDKSVKFWQFGISSVEPTVVNPGSTPTTLPLVSSISLRARVGVAISSNTDGEVKTWDISASDCKAPSQALIKYYQNGYIRLINNKLIFVWYMDEEISVWDTGKEAFLLQVGAPEGTTLDLRISGDGSKLFYIHHKFIQAWDIWTGQTTGKVEYEGIDVVGLLGMDGSRVWVKFDNKTVSLPSMGWDLGPSGFSHIRGFTEPPKSLHLSGTRQWDTGLCRITDTATGRVAFQLPPQFGTPVDVKWNGQYLVVSFQSRMELILEFHPTLFGRDL